MTAPASEGTPGSSGTSSKGGSFKAGRQTRVIAIANQKGGVGKSTTAVSLGAALAENGHRVLVVDLDPQGNASTGLGIRHEARETTVYDVLASEASIEEAVVQTQVPGLSAVPSTIDLAGAEIELVSQFSREGRLKRAIEPLRESGEYDFVILDCPPSLGLLTVNALTAAAELIVPIQCEYYALEGLGQLLRNVGLVQQNINPNLRLSGIVMTMFDQRTKLSEQVVAEVQRYFGDLVYDVIIPRTVRLSEAPGFGQPITVYDSKSKGAECYRRLAVEVAGRPPQEGPIPSLDDLATVVMPVPEPAHARSVGLAAEAEELPTPTVGEIVEQAAPEQPIPPEEEADRFLRELEAEAVPELEGASSVTTTEDDDLWEDAETPLPDGPSEAPPGHVPSPDEEAAAAAKTADEPERPSGRAVAGIGQSLGEDGKRKRRWRLFRKGGE